MKRTKIAMGIVLILAFLAFGASSFKKMLTPYVSFQEARAADRQVQIAGKLSAESTDYDEKEGVLTFNLVAEDGERMHVRYAGPRPVNFDEAENVVVIGRYEQDHFNCSRMLVKCPSKYEGQGERDYAANS